MGKAEDYVYNMSATLTLPDGVEVPVTWFTLDLRVAGIPKLTASIDPFHIWGAGPTPAGKPTVNEFIRRWQELQGLVTDKANRAIKFSFYAVSKAEEFLQSIDLSGWIITSVGMRDVRATGNFSLAIEAVHPLYKFQESTAHLLGSGVGGKVPLNAITGTNVYQALLSAMKVYLARHSKGALVKQASTDTDYNQNVKLLEYAGFKAIREKYQDMIDVLSEHLAWDGHGSGFPDKPFSVLRSYVPYGVLEYVKALNNTSSWDWLIGTFCAQWFLTIVPTYWEDTLKIKPLVPWQPPSITLNDDEVSQIDIPPVDAAPIKGVMGLFDSQSFASVEWQLYKSGEESKFLEEMSFTETKLEGRFLTLATPSWARDLLINSQMPYSSDTCPKDGNMSVSYVASQTAETADHIPEEPSQVEWRDLKAGLKAIAKELFLENYRMHYQMTLNSRLLIKHPKATTPGQYVIPGYVMRITGQGESMLDLYVTHVVHSVDCAHGSVSTQIGGSYVHTSDQPNLAKSIHAGVASNELYGDSGV